MKILSALRNLLIPSAVADAVSYYISYYKNDPDSELDYYYSDNINFNTIMTYDEIINATSEYTDFSREGYVFKEWNTKADGSGTVYHSGEHIDSGGYSLYAIWLEETQDIALSSEGARVLYKDLRDRINNKAPVIEDTASGAIASFTDGADDMPMALTVGIEPVQDLHGYENPWPGGGGKNLLNSALFSNASAEVRYIEIDLTPNATYTASTNLDLILTTANFFFMLPDDSASTSRNGVSTGVSMSVTTGSDGKAKVGYRLPNGMTVEQYLAKYFQIESGSTATSYAPYSNICPITGWTGAKLTKAGKNLAVGSEIERGTFTNSGVPASSLTRIRTGYIPVEPNKTITISTNDSDLYVHEVYGYKDIGKFYYRISSGPFASTFTTTYLEGVKYIRFSVRFSDNSDIVVSDAEHIMVEYGENATGFYPYAQNYPITFPSSAGTVYGGTLTVNKDGTGSLVVDRYSVSLANASNVSYHTGTIPSMWLRYETGKSANANSASYCITNMYRVGGYTDSPYVRYYGSEIDIYDDRFTDEATARALLADFICVYKLANANIFEIQLTAPQVKTILGLNNIWADTGDTTANYPADTKLYIDKKFAELQALIQENISNS